MNENALAEALKKRRQLSITVTGRRTGRAITVPVWFVSDATAVWLLPVHGSRTHWYRNLLSNRAIAIQVGKERHDFRARLVKDRSAVRDVIGKFRDKYTPEEIKRWYTGLDVAVKLSFATLAG